MKSNFFFICFVLSVCLLTGCRHVEYVAVPEVRYEHSRDTVHDSVDRWHTHYEFVKGDTMHSIDTFYQDRWHIERSVDTLTEFIPVIDTAATNSLRRELQAVENSSRRLKIRLALLSIVFLVWMGWRAYCRLKGNLLWRNISTE